ncbi:hypothetical protein Mgra_00009441, partial [Meloidogyne graminicola]
KEKDYNNKLKALSINKNIFNKEKEIKNFDLFVKSTLSKQRFIFTFINEIETRKKELFNLLEHLNIYNSLDNEDFVFVKEETQLKEELTSLVSFGPNPQEIQNNYYTSIIKETKIGGNQLRGSSGQA